MDLPEALDNPPSSKVNTLAEKADAESTKIVTAYSTSAIPRNKASTKANFEGNTELDFASDEEAGYPRGITFVLLTTGLMAVVLVLALDNYIICPS